MTEKRKVEINKLDNSSIEIKSSISVEELNKYKGKALKELGENISIAGFRKGHIPEKTLIDKVGEMTLLNQMAEMALSDIYPVIVLENKLEVIGQPHITITKMAINSPVEFKITSAVLPKFELPDYKKIAKKINSEKTEAVEVTEQELSDTIKQVQRMNPVRNQESETPPISNGVNTPQPEVNKNKEEKETTQEPALPEINDEFVKKLGDFKDVEDFKTKLKESIRQEKTNKSIEAKRVKIMEAILKDTSINLPDIIIESETNRLLAQTKADITRMGLQFNKYLEHIKKTEEDLRKELQPDAEKRSKIQFILDKIIKTEEIKPNEEETKQNVEQILSQNKEAKEENVRPYVEMVLSNQEVFKLLEKA